MFVRVRPGVLVKTPLKVRDDHPRREERNEENRRAFAIEKQIFEHLGSHPAIVP
jgi:hypothetical protein